MRYNPCTSQIYPRSQLIIFISLFCSVCSQHVSAPTGHLQVAIFRFKHNIIYIFMKTIIPQHIRYFYNYSPIWCTSLFINLNFWTEGEKTEFSRLNCSSLMHKKPVSEPRLSFPFPCVLLGHVGWVPVTTIWRVLGLRVEGTARGGPPA
jgi:hypothetical protein